MKKLFYAIALAAGLLGAVSCVAPGLIVDWTPVDITIEAYDAEGNSIVSEDMPGMTLTFRGEEYTVRPWDYWNQPQEEVQTKAYAAIMAGLRAMPINDEQGAVVKYVLQFGEIDGAEDLDENIVLHWPDGSEDTIHYHCSNHRNWTTIDCTRKWKLNGKKHDGAVFVFHGKSLK